MRINHMRDISLETEMKLRLVFRCLMWDLVGEDYDERATWIMATFRYFIGPDSEPKAQALVFLLTFGYPCSDALTHYDNASDLNFYQRAILEDLHNHTDWECFTEAAPADFHEGKQMFLPLAQAICCCMTQNQDWKTQLLNPILDEMFQIPSTWMRENVAGFLLFCSEQVTSI